MWQAPTPKAKAIAAKRQKDKDRHRVSFHLKRVPLEIRIVDPRDPVQEQGKGTKGPITEGRLILNDLGEVGMSLFVKKPLSADQRIAITMNDPMHVYVEGIVQGCQREFESHVLSKDSYAYRMSVKYVFKSDQDREAFQNFCRGLREHHVYSAA